MTAAATAIAIWVFVPNRPATLPVAAPAEESQASSARADADTSAQRCRSTRAPETQNRRRKLNSSFATSLVQRRANEAMKPPANLAAPSAPPEPPPAPAAPMASPGVASDSRRGGGGGSGNSRCVESVATSESFLPRIPSIDGEWSAPRPSSARPMAARRG